MIPLNVQFTSQATGGLYEVISWEWDFGDGNPINTDENPTHTYTTPGIYTVTLTITTIGGAVSETKQGFINATEGVPTTHHGGLLVLFTALLLIAFRFLHTLKYARTI